MKASRFSDAQKAFILKQGADGMPVADICRKAGISQATYFNWKRKYDGLLPTVTTSLVAPDRPASNNVSRRFAKPAFATAIGAFTCCCGARVGRSIRRRHDVSIAS